MKVGEIDNRDLNALYKQIVQIQKETVGATFVMGYSTRSNKHYLYFNNKAKRFESDTIEDVLKKSIEWIKKIRVETEHTFKYSMFDR